MKFERCDHSVFSISRFTSGWPELKLAVGTCMELIGTASICVISASPSIVTRA